MTGDFDAPWWTLDQAGLWIALRHRPIVERAGREECGLADLATEAPPDVALSHSATNGRHLVTYLDLDECAPQVVVMGISLRHGEPVDVFETLDAATARGLVSMVAGNPYFKVQGVYLKGGLGERRPDAINRELGARLGKRGKPVMPEDVIEILRGELASGNLTAVGRPGESARRRIREEEWLDLRIEMFLGRPLQVTTGLDRFDDVRVRRKDVLRLFPVPRGRPGGSSPYREHDMELVQEMHKLIETGEATSPHAAAVIVGPKARGGGGVESKVKRLERAFTPARRN